MNESGDNVIEQCCSDKRMTRDFNYMNKKFGYLKKVSLSIVVNESSLIM